MDAISKLRRNHKVNKAQLLKKVIVEFPLKKALLMKMLSFIPLIVKVMIPLKTILKKL
jgi:hypothetical protein